MMNGAAFICISNSEPPAEAEVQVAVINTVCTEGGGLALCPPGGATEGHGGRGHRGTGLVVSWALRTLREARGLELQRVLFDPR